jgi:hypothetical protein
METLLIILAVYLGCIIYITIGTLVYKYLVKDEVKKYSDTLIEGISYMIIPIWPIFILALPLYLIVDYGLFHNW